MTIAAPITVACFCCGSSWIPRTEHYNGKRAGPCCSGVTRMYCTTCLKCHLHCKCEGGRMVRGYVGAYRVRVSGGAE